MKCLLFIQVAYKFSDGRRLPTGFRKLRQEKKNSGGRLDGGVGDDLGEPVGPESIARGRGRKAERDGYTRSDNLDRAKLEKYIKSVALEAKLFREARKE